VTRFFYRTYGKRALDLLLASTALILLSPLLIAVALLVRMQMGSPVLFRQERPGRHGEPFQLLKFRTMLEALDATGKPLPDGERLTMLGRSLRSTSIDELPELINVIRGEMSLVGPRPLLFDYLPLYTPEQSKRHDATPGITGWAQVNGRNSLSWEERFRLDVWYIDHVSLQLDMKILALTFGKVVRREGINEPGEATAKPFRGSARVE
jgi:sugar transferase EpsL